MYFLTILVSEADSNIVPEASRMNFVVRLIMPWRLPATPAFARPEAVKLKRFFAADLVFILGISISNRQMRDSACLSWPAAQAYRSRVYRGALGISQVKSVVANCVSIGIGQSHEKRHWGYH